MQSGVFSIPRSRIFQFLLLKKGRLWVIASLLIAIVMIVTALLVSDARFYILALMIIFLMLPMALAFIILNYSLHPDVAFNILPHKLSLKTDGIEITTLAEIATPDNESDKSDVEATTNKPDRWARQDAAWKARWQPEDEVAAIDISGRDSDRTGFMKNGYRETSVLLPFEDLQPYIAGLDEVIIPFREKGLLFISKSAFSQTEDFVEFIRKMGKNIKIIH